MRELIFGNRGDILFVEQERLENISSQLKELKYDIDEYEPENTKQKLLLEYKEILEMEEECSKKIEALKEEMRFFRNKIILTK